MEKIIKIEVYKITTPSNKWVVPVIQGKVFYEVCALYDENKRIMDVNYNVSENFDNIIIDFGFDNHIGYVKYAWIEYVDTNNEVEDNQTVNVNVNCDDENKTPINDFKTEILSASKEFKIAELIDSCIMIDYMLKSNIGEVEGGRIIVINDRGNIRLDAERFMNSSLLDIGFYVNKNNDVINLKIVNDNSTAYEFKYKSTIY